MFARLSLPLLAAVLMGVSAPADEAKSPEFGPKPKWKAGDVARYEMTQTHVRGADGTNPRKVSAHTPVEVEVVDKGDDGWILRWTQGTTVFDDPKMDDDPLARAINGILKSTDVDLDLDERGALVGVRNWKELRGTGHKIQDAVLAQMAKAGTPKPALDSVRKETDKLFASKESIELAFTRQSALLFLPYGREYEQGRTTHYDSTLPNVLGGDEPFPARGEYTLKSFDKEAGVAVVAFKLTPDPKEMARVLQKWLDELAKKNGKPAPKELPELELVDTVEYEFDANAGWVRAVTHTRTAKHAGGTQVETTTLARKSK